MYQAFLVEGLIQVYVYWNKPEIKRDQHYMVCIGHYQSFLYAFII